jgi:hypothetical protein
MASQQSLLFTDLKLGLLTALVQKQAEPTTRPGEMMQGILKGFEHGD